MEGDPSEVSSDCWTPLALLTPDVVAKAETELNEKYNEKAKKVLELRETLANVPNLMSRTDDEFLIMFLRAKKYDVDESLQLVKNYYQQKIHLPHLYRTAASLPPNLALRAEAELNEIGLERESRIQRFREAVNQVEGLRSRTDDAFLLRFLRARKFNQDRALQLLKNYYRQRIKYPHLYKQLSASSISNVLESNVMGMLPYKDREGKFIFVYNSSERWDPEKVPLEDGIRYCLLTLERAVEEQDFQILGVVSIADCRGFGMNHLRCFTPSKLAQFFSVTQNSFPARFKEFHFINEPPVFDFFYALLKPFISKKLKERIFFHGSALSSLHGHFSPDILPQEFGGHLGPFSSREWNNKLLRHDVVVKKGANYGFDTDSTAVA